MNPEVEMKRKRVFIIDEITESCRLMPNWIQSIFFFIMLGIATFIVPVISYFFLGTIIILQLIVIILLAKKNIVYKRISKIEVAVEKMVIWIHSKKDEDEKYKKALINLALIIVTLLLFYKIQNVKLLIINSLFCLLFFLKLLFYVPLISVRIIDDDKDVNKFFVIDKGLKINTEINLYQIRSMEIISNKIEVDTNQGKVEIPIDFRSDKEKGKLKMFLKKVNKFEIK